MALRGVFGVFAGLIGASVGLRIRGMDAFKTVLEFTAVPWLVVCLVGTYRKAGAAATMVLMVTAAICVFIGYASKAPDADQAAQKYRFEFHQDAIYRYDPAKGRVWILVPQLNQWAELGAGGAK